MNQSDSSQMVPQSASDAEEDEYHLRTYELTVRFQKGHSAHENQPYGNTSVQKQDKHRQSPSSQLSFYLTS